MCARGGVFAQVLNVVHGTHDVVNMILDHPDIKAISFVGSDQAGRYIYKVVWGPVTVCSVLTVCWWAGGLCLRLCLRSLRTRASTQSRGFAAARVLRGVACRVVGAARGRDGQAGAEQPGRQEPRRGDA